MKIITYKKKTYICHVCNENNVRYNLTKDLKTCGHTSFEMVVLNFGSECRYFRYIDLNIVKQKTILLMTHVSVLVNHGVYIEILGNECRNSLLMTFLLLSITFLERGI